jgi:DNA-binding beta-propeller fold protein YncE
VPAQFFAQQPYHILNRWKIGGEGKGWDYVVVDPVTHNLYVAHDNQVQVVSTTTGKVVGAIKDLDGCHGVGLDTAGKLGYISNGNGMNVVIFDRHSLATVGAIPIGGGPDGIVFEPVTQTVWTFNSRGTASVIDPAAKKVVTTIKLGGGGESPQVDGKGNVFGNVEGKLIRIDARAKTIAAQWPTGCTDASGLGVDVEGHRLFQACDGGKMEIVDSETGKVLGTAGIGDDPDSGGYSPKYKLGFASTNDGLLSVVGSSGNGYTTVEKLPTMKGARTMAYDPAADRIYTVSAEIAGTPSGGGRPNFVPESLTVIVIGR